MNICALNLDVFKAFLVHVSLAGVVTTVSFSLTFELKLNFDLQCQTVQLLFPVQDEIIYFRCKYMDRVYGVLLLSVGSPKSYFFSLYIVMMIYLFPVLSKINSCWLLWRVVAPLLYDGVKSWSWPCSFINTETVYYYFILEGLKKYNRTCKAKIHFMWFTPWFWREIQCEYNIFLLPLRYYCMLSEPSVNAEQVFNEIKTNIYICKCAGCVVFYKCIEPWMF